MSPAIFAKYAPGQSSAIAVVVTCAILATLALSFVLIRLVWVASAALHGRSESIRHSRMGYFFRTQLGVFVGCLLACNLLTSISGLISINWIAVGGVKEGFNCTSQAVLSEMGNFGSAYFMVVLGVHAFNSLVLRNRHANWINTVLVAGGWVATIVIGVAPAFVSGKAGPLYGATSFNCGFTQRYPVQHLLLHFLPTFLASVLSTVVYSLVFLILRGTLIINGGLRLNLNPESRWIGNSGSFVEYQRFVNSIGRSMLWFPAAFIILLLPSTIVQLMDISNFEVSFTSISFALTLEILFGLVNVVILINVLRVLGPAIDSSRTSSTKSDIESFGQIDGKFSTMGSVKPLYLGSSRSEYLFEKASFVSTEAYAPPARLQSAVAFPKQAKTAPTPVLSHKRSTSSVSSTNSTSRLITPPKYTHSPANSVSSSGSAASLQRSIVAYPQIEEQLLPSPPQALQKIVEKKPTRFDPNEVPERRPSIEATPTPLPAAPRRNRSPVSRDLSDISLARGVPAQKDAPAVERKNTTGSSVINLYLSRSRSSTEDMPPLPVDVTDDALDAPLVPIPEKPKASLKPSKYRRPQPPPYLPDIVPVATSPRELAGPQTARSESYYTSTDDESDIAVSPPPAPGSARTISSSLRAQVRERTMTMASSAGGFQIAAMAASAPPVPPQPAPAPLNLRRLPNPPASANSISTSASTLTSASAASRSSALLSTGRVARPLPAPVSATGQQSFAQARMSQSLAQAQARMSVSVSPLHIRKGSSSSVNVGIRRVGSLMRAESPVDVRRSQSARDHSAPATGLGARAPAPSHSRLRSSAASGDKPYGYL